MIGIEAVAGYAIGTLQIVLLDWWRKVAAHRRQLRLLRAELRRLAGHSRKFDWIDEDAPDASRIPVAPVPTEAFAQAIADIDFAITDAHRDDNSQEALLSLVAGCVQCARYIDRFMAAMERARDVDGEIKNASLSDAAVIARAYDEKADQVLFAVDYMLGDIESRLDRLTISDQFARAFDGLPSGSNPAAVEVDDPRIAEWKARKAITK